MNVKKTRGDFGENAVCDYLLGKGYTIVARNYLKRQGEIDIVATHNDQIAFVEVKTRKFDSLIDGFDSITITKRRKIVKTAHAFLAENPQFADMNTQFDAAQVVVTTDEFPRLIEIDYCENAFEPMFL
jgi:putative endonuclease